MIEPLSAQEIVERISANWEELSRDSKLNREDFLRNLLTGHEIHVAKKVIADITQEIKP